MMVKEKIIITGLLCLTTIQGLLILNSCNITCLNSVIGIIAITIGITVPSPIQKIK